MIHGMVTTPQLIADIIAIQQLQYTEFAFIMAPAILQSLKLIHHPLFLHVMILKQVEHLPLGGIVYQVLIIMAFI